jgi:hypothetical protein
MSIKENIKKNLEIYLQKRIIANRICRRKKNESIERKIKEINEKNRKHATRKRYKDVRYLTNPSITTTLVCTDKDGNIPSEKRQALKRWQKYLKELLNPVTTRINITNIHESLLNNSDL